MPVIGRPGFYMRSGWLLLKATTAHKLDLFVGADPIGSDIGSIA